MNIETPKNEPEGIGGIEEVENVIEMSPEDFQVMMAQLPVLKEMLQEREKRITDLGKDTSANVQEVETLRVEIEELRQEISEREELL